jgi:hypothetical protein
MRKDKTNNHKGTPMLSSISLGLATRLSDIATWLLIFSLIGGVVATGLIWAMSSVKEFHWDKERAASKERIAKLDNETARLQENNLALQKQLQPRRLSSLPNAEVLKKFSGTKVFVVAVNDFESTKLAEDIRNVLTTYGWTLCPLEGRSLTEIGIDVSFSSNEKYVEAAQVLADAFTKAGLARPEENRIVSHPIPPGVDNMPGDLRPNNPDLSRTPPIGEGIIVYVGVKPIAKVHEAQ